MKIVQKGNVYHLRGELSELSDFSPLASVVGDLVLEMSEIREVNSIGVRSLIAFLQRFKGGVVIYRNCSAAFVDCFLLVPHILRSGLGNVVVESVQVPWECNACSQVGHYKVDVVDVRMGASGVEVPFEMCDRSPCGRELAIDQDDYFFFVKDQPKLPR